MFHSIATGPVLTFYRRTFLGKPACSNILYTFTHSNLFKWDGLVVFNLIFKKRMEINMDGNDFNEFNYD